jgi:hypothetical protein
MCRKEKAAMLRKISAVCLVVGLSCLGCATNSSDNKQSEMEVQQHHHGRKSHKKFCGYKRNELEESFIPLPGYTPHQPTSCDQVAYLEKVPTDRKFREVGIIAPRTTKQNSWGDAMHAALAAAALKGADAVCPVSEKELETWGFSVDSFRAYGGKTRYYDIRLKAIAWEDQQASH